MCRANFGAKLTEELENTAPEARTNLAQRFNRLGLYRPEEAVVGRVTLWSALH
jgi:hypothetical protein